MAQKQPSPRTLSPDIPVVSYPTPSTSDLLVVQDVDTRLPGYAPANYGDPHPDSATYPNLKLVYQTPIDQEANSQWIRRVYANERFNQEAYNYAVKYSGEDRDKPIYVRTYTLPRATYQPLTKGTADPVYSNAVLVEETADRIKDDQTDGQLDSLFIKVTRVYETLPGPALTTIKKGSAQSIPAKFQAARQVTVTKTTVTADTVADDTTATIVESSIEQATVAKAQKINSVLDTNLVTLIGNKVTPQQQVATVSETMVPTGSGLDSLVADILTMEGTVDNLGNGQSVVTKVQAPELFTEQTYASEKPLWGIPMKFKVADPPIKESHVTAGTVSSTDVTLGPNDMDKTAEQVTKFKKKVTTSTMSSDDQTLTGTQTGMWGVESVTEKLLHSSAQASGSYTTKEDSVDPIGDGRFVQKTIKYPSSPATLVEYHVDETYKIPVRIEKNLVNPSSPVPTAPYSGVVERHAVDPWNSIQIVSYVKQNELPPDETWHHTINYSFPDELVTVGVYYTTNSGGSSSSGGVNNAEIQDTDSWSAEASAHGVAKVSAVPFVKIKSGYSGPCKAVTTRKYYYGAPSDDVTPTLIRPVSGAIVITGTGQTLETSNYVRGTGKIWTHSGGGGGGSYDVVALRHTFGPVLYSPGISLIEYGNRSISGGAEAGAGSVPSGTYPSAMVQAQAQLSSTLELPDCDGHPFTKGDSIIATARTEKWRFGIWIRETTTVYHP